MPIVITGQEAVQLLADRAAVTLAQAAVETALKVAGAKTEEARKLLEGLSDLNELGELAGRVLASEVC